VWAGWLASDPGAAPAGRGRRHRLRERLRHSGGFYRGSLDLAIDLDGRLIGDVQARQGIGQRLPPGVVELGIQLYEPPQRGKGYGTDAIRVLTDWLFQAEVAERVQASTPKGNAAMRRVLEKLGFTFEGVMRGFMPVGDRREDFALYAITWNEWRASSRRRRR
jgi:RimJ/RimL family protein N-acetyltransferase